ncbi:unnamed protein product [Microthlaspi erraticum]|uniref:SIAH-type domain-containing protein n=1 Tax=Microthlaspi erraticum TaxID=1685480 RepID=A0A6D2KUC0_9BRAS|nr:unnamed protein product [Microthlaspi erraticum]
MFNDIKRAGVVATIGQQAMETVLESIFVPCGNAELGCTKKLTYGKESTHEKECLYAPCYCPVQDCDYTGSFYIIEHHSYEEQRDSWELNRFRFGVSFTVRMNISDKIRMWPTGKAHA